MANTVLMSKLIVLALALAGCQAACPRAYEDLSPYHPQCLVDVGKDIVVSENLQQQLVDKHNEYRSLVKNASDMLQVKWDDALALSASKWARQCDGNYVNEHMRWSEPYMPGVRIVQNVGTGYASLMEALEGWYDERKYFNLEKYDHRARSYRQIIYAQVGLFGCGEADCSSVEGKSNRYQVCNYAYSGASPSVYTEGGSCCACQTCDSANKLCVCDTALCYNEGRLNVSTCSCDCAHGHTGALCGQ